MFLKKNKINNQIFSMTFNLKLFKFPSQEPLLTFSNSKCLFKVESINQPAIFFSLKLTHIRSSSDYENCLNEVNIHAMSCHPKIISYKGYVNSDTTDEFGLTIRNFYILLEFHHHNLSHEIRARKKKSHFFSFQETSKILLDLIEALTYLERKNICFRNISPENIFIFENEVKLGNFENAFNSIGESTTKINSFKGDIKYAEPKVTNAYLAGQSEIEYNYFKNDVYSLGLMVLEMISLQNYDKAFESFKKDPENLAQQINKIQEIYGSEADGLQKILGLMIRENANERPNFIELNELVSQMPNFRKEDNKTTGLVLSVVEEITEIKELDVVRRFSKNQKDLIEKGFKFEQSVILREEAKDDILSSEDDLNERESEGYEEIKENHDKKAKKQPKKTGKNNFLLTQGLESGYSSNFFGLDRDSNLVISELPGLKKFTPEKVSALSQLKQSLLGLRLKVVDLETLKIEGNRPRRMDLDSEVFVCTNKSHLNLVVKVIKGLNEENVFAILRRYEYINARNCKNILKLEEYALEIVYETGFFNLFLIFKHKKWDLKYAIQNKNFPAVDKLSIAKQIVKVFYIAIV